MKGSVLTTRTWFLLIGAALLISAGFLNFRQRAKHETPAWDGVDWVDTGKGVVAKSIERNSAGERAWLLPGDHLLGVSLDPNAKSEEIAHARDIQIYLDQARVGGQIHYLMERPSYPPETRYYFADLDNLGAIHRWTPRVLYINLLGLVYLFVGFFVLFKQGGRAPYVLHFATVCVVAFVFHFYTPTGSYRDLDLAIAFLRNVAFISFAPLFVHFCLLYPTKQQLFATRRWRALFLYLPAFFLIALAVPLFLRNELAKIIPPFSRVPVTESLLGFFYGISMVQFVVALVTSGRSISQNLPYFESDDRQATG